MARTAITPVMLKDLRYPAPAANSLDLPFTALTGSQGANGNMVALDSYGILLLWNTHAANPYNISFQGAGPYNRTGDSGDYVLQAGEICGGFVARDGMAQKGTTNPGKLLFDGSNAAIKGLYLRFPKRI